MSTMANKDWYEILRLTTAASTEQIAEVVEKRSRQAAALANTNPERSQQLREEIRAIKRDLLSGDTARAQYDASLRTAAQEAPSSGQPFPNSHRPPSDTNYAELVRDAAAQPYSPNAAPTRPQNRFLRFLQSGYTCWNCGESTLPGDKFCTQCRAQLGADGTYTPTTTPVTNPNACVYCGTIAASTHRYCRKCGAGRS